MCLLLLFATAALGWEIPPPPDLPPPPPPLPSPPSTSPQYPDCRPSQAPALSLQGDAVLLALLDLHAGTNCEILVTESYRQMAAITAVVSALPRMQTVPPTKFGLTVLDTCSSATIAQKTLVSEIVFLECKEQYPLGILATESVEKAIANVAAGARQRILRLSSFSSRSPQSSESDALWVALNELIELHWATVSLFTPPSVIGAEWLGLATRGKGICLLNSTAASNLSESDAIIVVGAFGESLESLVQSGEQHRRPGQPFIVMPLDVALGDEEALPDDTMILESTTTEHAQSATIAAVALNQNDSAMSDAMTEVILSSAAASGFQGFMEIAKTVIRELDGFTEIKRAKCSGKDICSGLPPSRYLAYPEMRGDDEILSHFKLNETEITRRSQLMRIELRQGNSTLAYFSGGQWTIEKSIPSRDAYLRCDSKYATSARDCSKCSNFEKVPESAGTNDHTAHQILAGSQENDMPVSDSTSATGPTILAASDGHLLLKWRHEEPWVAAVATVSAVGATSAVVIAAFMAARIFKGDILEGNPFASFVLLLTVLVAYAAVLPFFVTIPGPSRNQWRDLLCASRVFGTSVAYGLMFAVMLSRALMLASCDRDGGFLTHVSGYIQSSLCVTLASVPLWTVAAAVISGPATCASLSNGRLYALLLGYDLLLLVVLLATTPFIATSKRNYREGAFFSAAAALCVSVWAAWWALYLCLPSRWHDAAAASGLSGSATALLLAVFVPRTYMMMTAVVRDRLSSALPSLVHSTGGSGLIGGPLYFDPAAEYAGPAMSNRACDIDEGPGENNGTFRSAYRSPACRTPRALSPHDVTYERYESPNSPMKVTRF